jgi:hypothetical protein
LRLISLAFLKSMASPIPALEIKPATKLPNEMPPLTYTPVIIAEDAQFGIKTISAVIKLSAYFIEERYFANFSAPISPSFPKKIPKKKIMS